MLNVAYVSFVYIVKKIPAAEMLQKATGSQGCDEWLLMT